MGAALTQGIGNTQGLIAANGDVTLAAASLDNARGTIASVQGSATISSTGATQNDSGKIQTAFDLTLVNAGLSNSMASGATQAGSITAGRNASIQTNGQALNNAQGTIAASQLASLQTGALNNDGGLIQAGTALSIHTGGQTLSNANASQHVTGAGGITSQGTMALATGDVNNAQGFVGSKGALTATVANISNTAGGQIVGQSSVSVSSSGFDNRGGQVQTLGSLGIDAGAGSINNNASLMRSAENLSLTAATVINSNTLGSNQGIEAKNVAITANTVANNQGAIRADSNATVTSSGTVNNSQGLISAGNLLDIGDSAATRSLAVTNTGGTLISGQNTMLRAASLSGDGRILGQQDLSIDLTTNYIQKAGAEITANRNASLTSTRDITNSGKLKAGAALTVNANNIDNTATGDISGGITIVTATQTLTNRGVIDGIDTQINASTLNNLGTGRIYGDYLSIGANSINNNAENGTAATMAARTRLDVGVQTLNNREHALIFSGGDMAIGGNLDASRFVTGQASNVNNASATIEALGNLAINAGTLLNSNEHFTTQVQQVSGPVSAFYIQPQGNPVKAAGSNFVWENWSRAGQYRYVTSPAAGTETILGSTAIPRVGEQGCTGAEPNVICTRLPGSDYLSSNPAWSYFALTPPATEPLQPALALPVAPDPAGANTCMAGAGYNANACTAYNNELNKFNSDKTAYDTAWATYDTGHLAWTADTETKYGQLDASVETYNNGFAGAEIRRWTQYNVTRTESESKVISSDPGKILSGGSMSLRGADLVNDKSQIIAGATLSGDLVNLRNLQAQGQHVVHEEGTSQYTYDRWRGGLKRYFQREWDPALAYAPADEVHTIDLPVTVKLDNTAHTRLAPAIHAATTANISETAASSGAVSALVKTASLNTNGLTISALANASGNLAATVVGGGAINPVQALLITQATLANPTGGAQIVRAVPVNSSVPNTSLYLINPAGSAGYLIETDPRFASYRQWLGSDYLLQAMGYDPVTVQKRLGDGFYEQKLIREQVLALTGQRFLADHRSDDEQFQALMDQGISYARQWNLRPGIALTAVQMAQLTSDIVWLVEQSVTLADGTKQKVLVPQLYVRVKEGDLDGAGALLAGKDVNLKLTGDLTNSGTIAGRQVVSLNAQNIHNLGGRIKGDAVAVQAREDLNNIGGSISAGSQLIATAGRDLNIVSTTQSNTKAAGLSTFARTNMDRVAGLYVTGERGVLVASAGRDANIIAGVISNTGQQSSTVIAAGRDLNLGTVQLAVQENNVRNSTNYLRQGTSEDIGSQVQAAGSLRLQAGNDIIAKAAEVGAGGALTALAGNDITISQGEQNNAYSEGRSHTNRSGLGSSSRTTRDTADSTTAIGSSLQGQRVTLQAGNTLRVTGSAVASDQGTALVAGNNLIIEAAQNTRSESHFWQEKKSGIMLNGSLSNPNSLSLDFKRGASSNATSASTTEAGSTVTSANEPTTLIAQNGVLAVIASNVSAGAGKTLTLQGAQVYLSGALNSEESSFEQTKKATNIHAGIVKPSEGLFSRGGVKGTSGQTTLAATTLAGGNISIQATGTPGQTADGQDLPSGISLAGVKLTTPGELKIDAGDGKLAFNIIQTTTSTSRESTQRDLVYQKAKGQGTTSTDAEYNDLMYGKLTIKTPNVVIQQARSAGAAGALTPATLTELGNKPGMGWIADVQRQQAELARTNPAAALHIENVKLAHEQWDYKQQGLTPEGAVIVTIVVAYFTAGAGTSLVGAATTTAGVTTTTVAGTALATTTAVGVTTYTAVGAAINAGFSSLVTQASIAFVNNNGDIGATLKQLGSSDSIKLTVAAMLTAGVGTALPSTGIASVAAQSATGCVTGSMTGIGCSRGATNAAITSRTAFAYTNTVGYAANAGPGDNRNGAETGNGTYLPDSNGRQIPADQGMNVIGFNGTNSPLAQGGPNSQLLNNIPFVNATAGLHDWIFNASPALNGWFAVLNVPTMIPAALLSIPAAINNPSLSWMLVNGTPYKLNIPSRSATTLNNVELPRSIVLKPAVRTPTQQVMP